MLANFPLGASQEGSATNEEDGGAEDRGDEKRTGKAQVVAEPVLHHVGEHHDGNRQGEAPPKEPTEHRSVASVAAVGVHLVPTVGRRPRHRPGIHIRVVVIVSAVPIHRYTYFCRRTNAKPRAGAG